MKFSLRTLIATVLFIGVLCSVFVWFYIEPSRADLPFATISLDGGLEGRLWSKPNFYSEVRPNDLPGGGVETITSPPKTGRSLFVEIWRNEELVYPLREMDVDFSGPADSVDVSYSKDRQFAAIHSGDNPDLLVLADLGTNEFASPMTIWSADYDAKRLSPIRSTCTCLLPGPIRQRWDTILQSIRSANPELEIDWNCLK